MNFDLSNLSQMVSPDALQNGLLQNNYLVPLASVMMLGVARRFMRFGFGLLPMVALALFMFSKDRATGSLLSNLMGGGGEASQLMPAAGGNNNLLLILFVLAALWYFGGIALFALRNLIPLLIIAYLLFSRDFKLDSVLQERGSASLLVTGIAALFLLFLLKRVLFAPRYYNPNRLPFLLSLARFVESLRPAFKYIAGVIPALLVILAVANPPALENRFPGWRESWGVALFFISAYGLGTTLPERYQKWIKPAFWLGMVLIIGLQVWGDFSRPYERF